MDVHIYLHGDDDVNHKLDRILKQLGAIQALETLMADELATLTTQVSANTDAENAALVLINGIAARIAAAGTDPAKLQALTDSLKTSGDALAAAVIANTPAA